MAINYDPTNWVEGKEFNPDNCNHWEQGIKSACDGVDRLDGVVSTLSHEAKDMQYLGYVIPSESELQNEYTESGDRIIVKRVSLYDLTWTYSTSGGNRRFIATLPDEFKNYPSGGGRHYCYIEGLQYASSGHSDKICFVAESRQLFLYNYDYTDVESFRNWLVDKYVYCEIETPYTPKDGEDSFRELDRTNAEIASLKYLGWTVPRGYNGSRGYQDAKGAYHQRGYRVDLGSLNWVYESGGKYFQATNLSPEANTAWFSSGKPTAYAAGFSNQYSWGDIASDNTNGNNAIAAYSNQVLVHHGSYTDPTAFRSAMSGTYLYYELATEVVIAEGNEVGAIKQYNLSDVAVAIKSDHSVTLSVNQYDGLVTVSGTNIGRLPEGFRPIVETQSPCACGAAQDAIGRILVRADGYVIIACHIDAYYARGSVTFKCL